MSLMNSSSGAVNAGGETVDDKDAGETAEMIELEQILEMIYPSD